MSRGLPRDFQRPVALASPPRDSRIAGLYATTDLADAYAIALPTDAVADPERLARFVFGNMAPWVGGLMRMRDAAVGRLGLKTARQLKATSDRRISLFRIYERRVDEIVLGEDDRHLDFRISVMRTAATGTADARLTLSTVVHCHGRLGRVYLFVIAPFHRLIVRSGLRRAARLGWPRVV